MTQAIDRLGTRFAYEAGILLRTILEIRINYAWIRLSQPHSRSVRFFSYWSIERLRLLEKASTFFRPDDFAQRKTALEAERRKVRHLFRRRDKRGKMRWEAHWAKTPSIETRLSEVQKAVTRLEDPDLFLYGVYAYLSSAVHGSPNSINHILQISDGRLVSKVQPEIDPQRHRFGALLTLMWTIETFATDARLRRAVRPELRRLTQAIARLAQYRRVVRGLSRNDDGSS
jgi:hypothetical protein